MLYLVKELKLYTKLGPETEHKAEHKNLLVVIRRLKVFLELKYHNTEPLLHL